MVRVPTLCRSFWLVCSAAAIAVSGCSSDEVVAEVGKDAAITADDVATGLADGVADGAQTQDMDQPENDVAADTAPLGTDAEATDASQTDAVVWSETTTGTDASTGTDALAGTDAAVGSDTTTGSDTTVVDEGEQLCPGCSLTSVPAGHPGAPGTYALAEAETYQYIGGFGNGYAEMLVIEPEFGGVLPVLFFVHGKQLYDGDGFPAEFGKPYRKFLEHVASHGYIVAYVRVEQSLLDADHNRMADDLLKATKVLYEKVSTANPAKVAFAGHSMGAKIALLAAAKTLQDDSKNEFVDPTAVLAFAVSNEPPPIGAFLDAQQVLVKLPESTPTWFTFATGDDDGIATWKDPNKANAKQLYDVLKTKNKQLIIVQGTGQGDPNPSTSPELIDDHNACLSVVGSPNLAAGFAPESKSYLDALDWYGYWKWTVGSLNFHFKGGDAKWAYGDLRAHGGNLPGGGYVKHTVQAQGWTGTPTAP